MKRKKDFNINEVMATRRAICEKLVKHFLKVSLPFALLRFVELTFRLIDCKWRNLNRN